MGVRKRSLWWLWVLLPSLVYGAPEDELLDSDQAFRFSAAVVDGQTVRTEWQIAEGYYLYLYRDKLKFKSKTPGIRIGDPQLPLGQVKQDEFFGEVETYRHQLTVNLPVQGSPQAPLQLTVAYQGCADLGMCYPPQTQTVVLTLPAAESGLPPESPPSASPAAAPLSALQRLRQSLGLGGELGGQDRFLEPDQAFMLSADMADPNTVVARWDIAEGYYLYRERLDFKLKDANGVRLGTPEVPPGQVKEDEFLGRTEVYHDELRVKLPLVRSVGASQPVTLEVTYQGCAEAGLCYPPITRPVTLTLPAAGTAPTTQAQAGVQIQTPTAPPPATSEKATPLSAQDRLADSLASGSTWLVLLTFFGFGLLLAFTPCVFPMIPILSSIIVGEGAHITSRRAFILSLTYVLAMAVTYTLAGVIAGLFGQNLQAAFQNPWILGTFAAIFVLLALSMFGLYDLQLPSRWQGKLTELSNRQEGGRLVGVVLMGLFSALIVGPCVAPPLAGALIYIGKTGDAVLGGSALFALSLGMGAPLIAVGTSEGKLLPRAGAWMNAVKAVFGVLMLGVAIWLLERIVPVSVTLLLWAALLIVSAVYLGALEPVAGENGWRKLWKGAGLIMLGYGLLLMVGAATGGRDLWQPLETLAIRGGAGEGEELRFTRVKSAADFEQALAAARARQQPVVLDFYADWCVECKRMEKYTFSEPSVQQALAGALLLQADVTANDAQDRELLRRFGLHGPPATLFFGPDGAERTQYRLVGYLGPEKFRVLAVDALRAAPAEMRADVR
jgi:thiol:disulfide interchange protein DsbD